VSVGFLLDVSYYEQALVADVLTCFDLFYVDAKYGDGAIHSSHYFSIVPQSMLLLLFILQCFVVDAARFVIW
jgi:hypothetical protein